MSTITTLASGDNGAASRTTINTNFANLNTDKFEKTDVDVDTTLAANSDAKVPSQKAIKAYVDANAIPPAVSSEVTVGTTHTLTTTAVQRVIVWAKGVMVANAGGNTVTLQYNGVTKDSQVAVASSGTHQNGFCLFYTETPGAATANITVTGAAASVVIMVLKL
jgi:flagellar basal body rod protein FlgB